MTNPPTPPLLPPDGAYFVTAPHWEKSYVGHVKADHTALFHSVLTGWEGLS
jgi:hypothetical protein